MKDLYRRIASAKATFNHWNAKYRCLEVSETRRLCQARGRVV
jgi:hypothetical protein